MWWVIKKVSDDGTKIIYKYGIKDTPMTGTIEYDRITDKFNCTRIANGDTLQSVERFYQHLWRAIHHKGAPQTLQIAIG